MRTRIYLDGDDERGWDTGEGARYIDLSHEKDLTEEDIAIFRSVGRHATAILLSRGPPKPREAL